MNLGEIFRLGFAFSGRRRPNPFLHFYFEWRERKPLERNNGVGRVIHLQYLRYSETRVQPLVDDYAGECVLL